MFSEKGITSVNFSTQDISVGNPADDHSARYFSEARGVPLVSLKTRTELGTARAAVFFRLSFRQRRAFLRHVKDHSRHVVHGDLSKRDGIEMMVMAGQEDGQKYFRQTVQGTHWNGSNTATAVYISRKAKPSLRYIASISIPLPQPPSPTPTLSDTPTPTHIDKHAPHRQRRAFCLASFLPLRSRIRYQLSTGRRRGHRCWLLPQIWETDPACECKIKKGM